MIQDILSLDAYSLYLHEINLKGEMNSYGLVVHGDRLAHHWDTERAKKYIKVCDF